MIKIKLNIIKLWIDKIILKIWVSVGNNDLIKDRFLVNFILLLINFISNSDEIIIKYI